MKNTTQLVEAWLDKQHTDSYVPNVEEFAALVTEALSDCGSDVWVGALITIALQDVNWALLHGKEYRRHIEAQKEAEKNREEQEGLSDIPF